MAQNAQAEQILRWETSKKSKRRLVRRSFSEGGSFGGGGSFNKGGNVETTARSRVLQGPVLWSDQ